MVQSIATEGRDVTLQKIVSFGYKYLDAPEEFTPGVVIVDVRPLFQNPHRYPHLRTKNGQDPAVQAVIVDSPNFVAKYHYVKTQVTVPGTRVAYIGCHGGKHRSVFLAEKLGAELGIPVEHRDLTRP